MTPHRLVKGLAAAVGLLTILLLISGCRSTAGGAPATPPLAEFDVLWRYSDDTMRAPAMADGTIYVPSGDQIIALDALTGAIRWRYQPAAPQIVSEVLAAGVSS